MSIRLSKYLLEALIKAFNDQCQTTHMQVWPATIEMGLPSTAIRNGAVILNVSNSAISHLQFHEYGLSMQARFDGVSRELHIPYSAIVNIYDRDTGAGVTIPRTEAETNERDIAVARHRGEDVTEALNRIRDKTPVDAAAHIGRVPNDSAEPVEQLEQTNVTRISDFKNRKKP